MYTNIEDMHYIIIRQYGSNLSACTISPFLQRIAIGQVSRPHRLAERVYHQMVKGLKGYLYLARSPKGYILQIGCPDLTYLLN